MRLSDLVGKEIVAVKGYPSGSGKPKKYTEPTFLLFSDKETIVELVEQDAYDYHDCSASARSIWVYADKEKWQQFSGFPDANIDL